jgi:hypothetical protein
MYNVNYDNDAEGSDKAYALTDTASISNNVDS